MIEILELLDHFKGKAYLVDGTTASGMGIIDYPFDHSDLKFLLIDEIDKLSKKDQKVLLNVDFRAKLGSDFINLKESTKRFKERNRFS